MGMRTTNITTVAKGSRPTAVRPSSRVTVLAAL